MDKKLEKYLDEAFKPYGDFPALEDVKQELFGNLQEKFRDFTEQGYSKEIAYKMTIDSVGDIAEIMEHIPHSEPTGQQPTVQRNFSGSNIPGADLAGAVLTQTNMKGSALKQADFSSANLTNADLRGSDLAKACFDGANLTDARLSASALKDTTYKNDCTLVNTDFSKSDLSGAQFDGQTLVGVTFGSASLKNVSFKNTILRDVSFRHAATKQAIFDGATMDKLTYAVLKSAKTPLNDITIS